MTSAIVDPLNSINHTLPMMKEAVELSKRARPSVLLNRNLSAMSLQDMDDDDDKNDNHSENGTDDDAPQDFEYLEDRATKDKYIKKKHKSVNQGMISGDTAKTPLSPTSQLKDAKFHDALSTTEFLLSLPLVGGKLPHERGNGEERNTDGDSLSSLGSSIMLGESDFPTANADDRSLTCSNRLKLSMRTITRTNSGHDLAFASLNNSKRSLASKISLGSRKSLSSKRSLGNHFRSDNNASNIKPKIHRSNTADLVLNMIHKNHKSFTGGLALEDDDNDNQKIVGNASKGSINFPLKRSLSTGNRFQRTASSRSISSTDRLHQSLAKMMNQNQQSPPDCVSGGDEDKVTAVEEATGSFQRKKLSRNNSGRSVSSFLSVDSRRSMRHVPGRAPRRKERITPAANTTASSTTVSPSNTMPDEAEDAATIEQNRKIQRKARRRRSQTNLNQTLNLPNQLSAPDSTSWHSRSSRIPTEPEPNYVWTSDTKEKKKVNTLLRQLSKGPELARSKSLDSQTILKHVSARLRQHQQEHATASRRGHGSQSPSRIYSLDSGRLDKAALQAFVRRSNGRGRSPGRGIAPNQSSCNNASHRRPECKHHLSRSTSLGNTPLGRLTTVLTASLSSVNKSFVLPMTNLTRMSSLSDRQVKSTAQLLNASVSAMLQESMSNTGNSKSPPPRRTRAQSEGRRLQQQLRKNQSPSRHGELKSYISEHLISPKKSVVKKDPHSQLAALAALNRSVADNLEASSSSVSRSRSRSPLRKTQSLLVDEKRSPPRKTSSWLDDRKHSPRRTNSMFNDKKLSPPRRNNSILDDERKSPTNTPTRRKMAPVRLPQSPRKNEDEEKPAAAAAEIKMTDFGQSSSTGDLLDDSSRTSHHSDGCGARAKLMQRLPDMDISIQRRNSGNYLTMTELDQLMAPLAPSNDDGSHYDSGDDSDDDSHHDDLDDDSYNDSDDSSHDDSDAASFASEDTLESVDQISGPTLTSRVGGDADINKNAARRATRRRGGATEGEEIIGNNVDTSRPKPTRRLSNRDLAAQMNERIPSKKNLLQEIKTIVPFAARKTRNLKKDSKANDTSHFVTGSRIRRFVGGVEVTAGRTFQECYVK